MKNRLIGTFLMSFGLSVLMSLWMTFVNLGWSDAFVLQWMTAFLLAWPAAAVAAFFLEPLVERMTVRIAQRLP